MSSIPLPALSVRPPEQQDLLGQFSKLQALKGMQQQQQEQGLQIQQQQQQMADQKAMTTAMHEWDGKNLDDLPSLILKHGGSANAVFTTKQQILGQKEKLSQIAKDDATTGATNLETAAKKNDMLLGKLQSVTDGPSLIAATQDAVQSGLLDPQHAEAAQKIAQLPPEQFKQTLSVFEKSLMGQKAQFEQAQKEKTDTATILKDQAQAADATAGAALKTTENAQAGQVTAKDRFIQGQENYRAALARIAQTANQRQTQGITALQKQSDDYQKLVGSANTLKQSLQAAQDGNEMAAAVAPLQGTLFITTTEGVKRINQTELAGVEGAGSLIQRVNGALGKAAGGGPLSQSLKDDMSKLVDLYTESKYGSYKNQTDYTKQIHGLDKTTPILAQDGSIAGSKPASYFDQYPKHQ